eukprot:2745326-Pyramimonas_sp.AAC.1
MERQCTQWCPGRGGRTEWPPSPTAKHLSRPRISAPLARGKPLELWGLTALPATRPAATSTPSGTAMSPPRTLCDAPPCDGPGPALLSRCL